MEGPRQFLMSAPVRLAFWSLYGEQFCYLFVISANRLLIKQKMQHIY